MEPVKFAMQKLTIVACSVRARAQFTFVKIVNVEKDANSVVMMQCVHQEGPTKGKVVYIPKTTVKIKVEELALEKLVDESDAAALARLFPPLAMVKYVKRSQFAVEVLEADELPEEGDKPEDAAPIAPDDTTGNAPSVSRTRSARCPTLPRTKHAIVCNALKACLSLRSG